MFFTSLVNVEEHLNRIGTLIHRNEIKLIGPEIKVICNYITLITCKHKSIHPNIVVKLQEVGDKLNQLKKLPIEQLNSSFQALKTEFEKIYILPSVYLIRHPEKTNEKTRNLSVKGVSQAKGVAEYLAEECMLCPKPVHIYLYCSDVRRTYLFANIIQRKFNQLTNFYKKKVNIEPIVEHPALFFRFTQEALNEKKEDYQKSEYLAFTNWIKGKYKHHPNHNTVSEEVAAWVRDVKSKSNAGEWTIVVGISHSFIIDALLLSITHDHKEIISETRFAEFIGNKMFYDDKWYNFS